jgi:hypothetical protein
VAFPVVDAATIPLSSSALSWSSATRTGFRDLDEYASILLSDDAAAQRVGVEFDPWRIPL